MSPSEGGERRLTAAPRMVTYRDFVTIFRTLDLGPRSRVIVHASLSAFGPVAGGADTIVGALLSSFETVILPTFTYRTMIIPPVGPPNNGLDYGLSGDQSSRAEFWHPDMAADKLMGIVAETLRRQPESTRSLHPILSFAGVNAEEGLSAQSLEEPLSPIGWLGERDGDVLLLGVDHTKNTSLHFAERMAGRKQFVRWALTPQGIVECPGWPGCSDGFQMIGPRLKGLAKRARLGQAIVETVPVRDLVHLAVGWIREDPRALLCTKIHCERCSDVRASLHVSS